jgi:transcriptional regulator with XRE-family HTH domain
MTDQVAHNGDGPATSDPEISSFGIWVRDNRIKQNKSVPQLAKSAGIAAATLYGIEAGTFQNPHSATRAKLANALRLATPPLPPEPPLAAGLGALIDFNPHSKQEWPKCADIYVLYDISERPIYIGQSSDIARRLGQHVDRFWLKEPIVQYGSFIEVKDQTLRTQLEAVLIKIMKSNAVLNKLGVAKHQ